MVEDIPYQPDYPVSPGDTLLETLDARGMTQAELAERTGRPRKTINEIIKGKAPITLETALQLERVLGVPAHFWNALEANYREALTRQQEVDLLGTRTEWLQRFPWRAMTRFGWLPHYNDRGSQAQALLQFFGVASPEVWERLWMSPQAAFRRSQVYTTDIAAVAAWLRKGEIDAQQVQCDPYRASGLRQVLARVRTLTTEPPDIFVPRLRELCARVGVAVVFVRELPHCRVSGATRWLTSEKALVQLSLRFKTDDHLWFTFFHEVGHLLLHGKRCAFIETNGEGSEAPHEEKEANEFAADTLIPRRAYIAFSAGKPSKADVEQFAASLGIAPGIVIGRLQHDHIIPLQWFNDLKRHFQWSEDPD